MAAEMIRVGCASDVPASGGKAFQAGDFSVLVCNTRDGWFAVENVCSHQLQALEGGKIRGCFIFCPLHGQRFDLRSGAPIGQLTDKPLRVFDVKVEGENLFVSPSPRDVQG
jgi:3-phenylpropionate/trans-cinnamate dioxygenase ferredoxin subunit